MGSSIASRLWDKFKACLRIFLCVAEHGRLWAAGYTHCYYCERHLLSIKD